MNAFPNRGKLIAQASGHDAQPWLRPASGPATQDPNSTTVQRIHWQQMLENAGIADLDEVVPEELGGDKPKRKNFVWSLG
jgi:hypothetical protein